MRLVGLTGGIASGKSTVSRHFEKEGLPVVDADKVARVPFPHLIFLLSIFELLLARITFEACLQSIGPMVNLVRNNLAVGYGTNNRNGIKLFILQ